MARAIGERAGLRAARLGRAAPDGDDLVGARRPDPPAGRAGRRRAAGRADHRTLGERPAGAAYPHRRSDPGGRAGPGRFALGCARGRPGAGPAGAADRSGVVLPRPQGAAGGGGRARAGSPPARPDRTAEGAARPGRPARRAGRPASSLDPGLAGTARARLAATGSRPPRTDRSGPAGWGAGRAGRAPRRPWSAANGHVDPAADRTPAGARAARTAPGRADRGAGSTDTDAVRGEQPGAGSAVLGLRRAARRLGSGSGGPGR